MHFFCKSACSTALDRAYARFVTAADANVGTGIHTRVLRYIPVKHSLTRKHPPSLSPTTGQIELAARETICVCIVPGRVGSTGSISVRLSLTSITRLFVQPVPPCVQHDDRICNENLPYQRILQLCKPPPVDVRLSTLWRSMSGYFIFG